MHQVQRERQTSVQGRLCISVPAAVDHWLRLPFSRGQANSRCSRHSTARSWLKIDGIWRISVHLVRVLLRFTASTREGAPCRSTRLSRLIASRPYAPGYARPDWTIIRKNLSKLRVIQDFYSCRRLLHVTGVASRGNAETHATDIMTKFFQKLSHVGLAASGDHPC
jgi:hypothetical protein